MFPASLPQALRLVVKHLNAFAKRGKRDLTVLGGDSIGPPTGIPTDDEGGFAGIAHVDHTQRHANDIAQEGGVILYSKDGSTLVRSLLSFGDNYVALMLMSVTRFK